MDWTTILTTTKLLHWILGPYWGLLGDLLRWTAQHPVHGLVFWVWVFGLCFAAYSNFEATRRRGELKPWHWFIYGPAGLVGYPLDIIVGSCIMGWIIFRQPPWYAGWNPIKWTFTGRCNDHVDDPGFRGSKARYWGRILNLMCPGHVRAPKGGW